MTNKSPLKLFLLFSCTVLSSMCVAQTAHNHSHQALLRQKLPIVPAYIFNADSLVGFDEALVINEAAHEHFIGDDVKRISYLLKRRYIDEKYLIGSYALPKVNSSNQKLGNGGLSPQSLNCATENFDFENGTASGWALTGATSIKTSGTDPYGGFPWVYPGSGATSLRISDDTGPNGNWGQAVKTIAVPASGITLFTFHFAMGLFGYPHVAAAAAKFKVDFFDASNTQLACPKYECYHSTDNGDVGVTNFTTTPNPTSTYNSGAVGDSPGSNPATVASWNDVTLDLTAYAGQTITARFRIDWCIYGPDWAYCLIDANCPVNNFDPIPVCGGTGQSICAPPSMTNYTWTTPSNTTFNSSCITASSGGIYTLQCTPQNIQCSAAPVFTYLYDVSDAPVTNFTATPVCLGAITSFTNSTTVSSPNTISTWEWDFNNDGVVDNSTQNPSYTYSVVGTYTVKLTATANSGCKSTNTIQTIVYALPTASFTADQVCFSSPSHLLDASNGNGSPITNYAWDFTGDNIADITGPSSVNYVMPLVGNNMVNYTVITTPAPGLSCKGSTSNTVVTNPSPQAAFSFTNTCINTQPNNFDGTASSANGGTITDYAWNFGDGQTDSSPISTTDHTYSLPILYNVTLTVTSDQGCVGSISHQVEVFPIPIAYISSKPKICLGSPTTFTANLLPNSGNVVSWGWDVDNNINTIEKTGQNNSYTFSNEAWHVLNVVATTNNGCKETITSNVYVNYIPQPQFIVDDPDGCPLPHCVVFTDQTPAITGPAKINQWNWNFGNGKSISSATNNNQNTCYTNASSSQLALFSVTLTTKTDSGCVASNVKPNFITVYPTPVANYTIVPEFGNVIVPLVHFINQSVDYTNVQWSFGDGKSDMATINPNHTYNTLEINDYFTSLIVTNQYGCSDTAKVPVSISGDFVFYIPNAFSPNGDGFNEGFVGAGVGIAKYEMWIYNRWGANIYYTDDIYRPWNGKVIGKSEDAPQDVYTWKVELKDIFGKKHNYVGHVTLLR